MDVPADRVLTIQSPQPGPRPTLDGGDDDRILILTGTGAALIVGVNFQNGATDGSLPAGGGAINSSLTSLSIDSSRISSSSAVVGGGNFGGGILSTGVLTLSYAEIIGNTAGALGGGVAAPGGVAITGSSIRGNTSGGEGGGLYAGGAVRVESSEISANTAEGDGGGIDCECDQLIVQWVSLVDNEATTGQGGGIFGFPASAFLANVTASGNLAGNGGGAVSMLPGTDVQIRNATVTESDSGAGLGAVLLGAPTTTHVMTNSILYGNVGEDCSGFTYATEGTDSIVGTGGCIPTGGGDRLAVDPQLQPVGTYDGGATVLVGTSIRLLPLVPILGDSPAIDAGTSCEPTDVRGLPRVGPACDLGAFELTLQARDFRDDGDGTLGPPTAVLHYGAARAADRPDPRLCAHRPGRQRQPGPPGSGARTRSSVASISSRPAWPPSRCARSPCARSLPRRRGARLDLARPAPPRLHQRHQRRRLGRLPARPRSHRSRRAAAQHGHARPGAGGDGRRRPRTVADRLLGDPARLAARRRHRHGHGDTRRARPPGRYGLVHADRDVLGAVLWIRRRRHRSRHSDAGVDQPAGCAAAVRSRCGRSRCGRSTSRRCRCGRSRCGRSRCGRSTSRRRRCGRSRCGQIDFEASPLRSMPLRSIDIQGHRCGRSRCGRSTSRRRRCGRFRCGRSTSRARRCGRSRCAGRQPRRHRRLLGVPDCGSQTLTLGDVPFEALIGTLGALVGSVPSEINLGTLGELAAATPTPMALPMRPNSPRWASSLPSSATPRSARSAATGTRTPTAT